MTQALFTGQFFLIQRNDKGGPAVRKEGEMRSGERGELNTTKSSGENKEKCNALLFGELHLHTICMERP